MYLRITVLALVLPVTALLSSCGNVGSVLNPQEIPVTPRLQNNEPERRGALVNAAAFNGSAREQTMALYQGYVGPLRTTYEANRQEIEQDLDGLARVSDGRFNPNERVTVNFTDVSLDHILKQLLRGALGVPYVAPDDLPIISAFHIDAPVPKSRLLQIVRDLLARHDLVMRQMDGVYHIGPADLINSMVANAARGAATGTMRVVRLERANAKKVATLAGQLLPVGVEVLPSSSPDSLVVKANACDFSAVERMLQTLSKAAVGFDEVAILPLSQSAPEAVAKQLMEFYAPTLREEQERVTIVPLQNQQAVLVGTSHPSLMKSLIRLVAQLDRSATDKTDLRVIALTHLQPSQIAAQLGEIFGGDVSSFSQPENTGDAENTTGLRSRLKALAPTKPEHKEKGEAEQQASDDTAASADPALPEASKASLPSEIRIVADDRTNSLLVRSSYSVFKRMRDVVKLLDIPQAQVIIEATVVEVELNDVIQSGVEFLLDYSGHGSAKLPREDGTLLRIDTDIGPVNVQAALKALQTVTNVRVVSSPYLTVVDGEPARLVIGDQIPFAVSTQSTSGDGRTTTNTTTEVLDTGIVLQLTPRIHANNSVSLEVQQSVSKVTEPSLPGEYRPTISTRDITSQILAQSGRTVLLGGLIQERKELTEKRVPGAANIPVVGRLFRRNKDSRNRTELLVLITPRVSRSSTEIEEITRMLQGVQQYPTYPGLTQQK